MRRRREQPHVPAPEVSRGRFRCSPGRRSDSSCRSPWLDCASRSTNFPASSSFTPPRYSRGQPLPGAPAPSIVGQSPVFAYHHNSSQTHCQSIRACPQSTTTTWRAGTPRRVPLRSRKHLARKVEPRPTERTCAVSMLVGVTSLVYVGKAARRSCRSLHETCAIKYTQADSSIKRHCSASSCKDDDGASSTLSH